jgi:general stress protein 26
MDPFPPESDMTIWMGTNRKTRKVADIERDSRVTLYYYSPDASGYVTVTGRARLVDDAEEKAARWKNEWEAFYQDRASEYLLIQVVPERLEVVDYSRGIVGESGTWEPPSVEFRGGSPRGS